MVDAFIAGAETGAWCAGLVVTIYTGFTFLGILTRVFRLITGPRRTTE